MRVLFVVTPGVGHLFPMVPLAWALRAAGHEVLIATTGAGLVAANAGLAVTDVAPDADVHGWMRDRFRQYAALAGRPPGQPGPRAGAAATPAVIGRLFAGMSNGMADGVVGIAKRWPAEAIVQSALQGAGLIAAAKLGLPLIQHGFGLVRTAGANQMLHEHMADTFRRHRVSGLPERVAAIDVAPPSMVAAPEGWSMRYVPYNGGGVLPDDLLRPPEDRPRVAVTMGTVAPTMTGLGPVQRLIELAPQVDAQFVVALGDADTSGLGPVPHNVRLAGWVPLNALLHTSTALIHHGGAGSTLGALAAGVPQLVIPSGADRYLNGAAVAAAGAGLSRSEAQLDAPLVHRLLDDPALRDGARQTRSEIGSLPSPTQIARLVIDFARQARAAEPPPPSPGSATGFCGRDL